MNKLLSINYKFFKVEPQKLIEIINKNNDKNQIQVFWSRSIQSRRTKIFIRICTKSKRK